jgi:pimeloyl-ACP methyl ester carboxylesterase
MANPGGPGYATTAFRGFYLYAFEPMLAEHDLLLIDDRGRGKSGAVDCPDIQHATQDWFGNLDKCADQLTAAGTIDHYATGDIAQDTEAVRAALGYDKIDYYGVSAGAVDVEAYALRYPQHLRSIVLDSPWTSQNYTVDTNTMMRDPLLDRVRLICTNSPGCEPTAARTTDQIAWLAKRLASAPLRGSALDADGVRHDIVLDEAGFISRILTDDGGAFVAPGEIAAAIAAYRAGDPAPLLRLAAELDYTWPADQGDSLEFSVGDAFAVMCSEQDWQWDREASVPVRKAQYATYIRTTPRSAIAPFSRTGYFQGQRQLYASGDTCIQWPTTHANLPVPAHATYPDVPTLVLTSDLDLITPLASETVAPRWPNRTFVNVHGVGHATLFWGDCTLGIVQRFLTTLDAGDTSCASTPATAWWATGRFPTTTDAAIPAVRQAGDQSTGLGRRAATVTAQTVVDAVKRAFLASGESAVPGLRGGSLVVGSTDDGAMQLDLTDDQFAQDLAVTGQVVWRDLVSADLDLAGAVTGHVHIEGALFAPPGSNPWRVTGQIGGRAVVLDTSPT